MAFPTFSDLLSISDPEVLLTGLAVFTARIFDVSIGTVRTIVTVQGRTILSFFLAVFEVTIWITVVSAVILKMTEMPILIIFYSLGYAMGNVVGILVERRLAFGMIILKVFSSYHGQRMAQTFREMGQPVTIFHGEGMKGPVVELYLACRRRDLRWMIAKVYEIDSDAFYVVEQAKDVSKVLKPVYSPLGGWRQRNNRK
ncbi:hypothetical protein UWK_00588 [Desulfocapsa sulfexigens DSM 10523]|uniref:Uncharacterized protein n=1 Tax=Desulfocapsa sulfexigens (strain DSM 10523 / SB164P1) TaxID=1167006 RepID=M1NBI8_DESSD|nr:DUF5698 domain-containing protein [Desulfocapsa sulfexigens]AGF77169.1 hypothetical protein UWK_00588 [Desulfocapsa sulfexigens DSM 10523]